MMRKLVAIVCLLLVAACQRVSRIGGELPPPAAYVHFRDRVAAQMWRWGIPWRFPCTHTEKVVGSAAVLSSLPDEQCYKMQAPTRWRGLWRNDFEGSQFCPAPATECSYETRGKQIWLGFSVSVPVPFKGERPGGLYAVDFIGRAPAYRGFYGHLGVFSDEVIVDRMITMRTIEPPPRESQDGTLK